MLHHLTWSEPLPEKCPPTHEENGNRRLLSLRRYPVESFEFSQAFSLDTDTEFSRRLAQCYRKTASLRWCATSHSTCFPRAERMSQPMAAYLSFSTRCTCRESASNPLYWDPFKLKSIESASRFSSPLDVQAISNIGKS